MGRILTAVDQQPPPPSLGSPVVEFLQELAPLTHNWMLRVLLTVADLPGLRPLLARGMALVSRETASMVRLTWNMKFAFCHTVLLGLCALQHLTTVCIICVQLGRRFNSVVLTLQVRTTAAATVVEAGVADNVLPQSGLINYNFRLLPGEPPNSTLEYLKSLISAKDAPQVEIGFSRRSPVRPASSVTSSRGLYFSMLKQTLQEFMHFDGQPVPVLPFLLPGQTDSKHYDGISEFGTLRHVPYTMRGEDLKRVHGTNERMAIEDFQRGICVYRSAMRRFGDFLGH